ncbi:M12 family metallopeptidase [Zooshikella ganghwensis]|uniref:Peptidase metallopeptidase domain-containing protein n=1 Tax=Zooshikella ganghwensis TaxID=202772 RepID=A0A4P9VRR6_9GAMM|nr:M12 family metallopeptidase [Zooshikella ganghwensis]RDH45489.1 hypothetical protein B9G39_19690 [Zooshikella ganghwensis]
MRVRLLHLSTIILLSTQTAFSSVIDTSNKWENPSNIEVCWQMEEPKTLSNLFPSLAWIKSSEEISSMSDVQLTEIFFSISGKQPDTETNDLEDARSQLLYLFNLGEDFKKLKPNISSYKKLIENIIVDSYHKNTRFRFTGWKSCTEEQKYSTNNIRVYLDTQRLEVDKGVFKYITVGGYNGIGAPTQDLAGKGTLGFTVYPDPKNEFHRDKLKRTVIHEFGHALGLVHEHDRTDAKKCEHTNPRNYAVNGTTSTNGGIVQYVGPFDSRSIMSYCGGDVLTKGDIAGLNYLYPGYGHPLAETSSCIKNPDSLYVEKSFQHEDWCNGFKSQSSCEQVIRESVSLCKWVLLN